jgi:hypothetical protein
MVDDCVREACRLIADIGEPAGPWAEAGRMLGLGIPWDVATQTPIEMLEHVIAGVTETRGASPIG